MNAHVETSFALKTIKTKKRNRNLVVFRCSMQDLDLMRVTVLGQCHQSSAALGGEHSWYCQQLAGV